MNGRLRRVASLPPVRLILIVTLFGALSVVPVLALHPAHSAGDNILASWILAVALFLAVVVVERFAVGKTPLEIGFDLRRAPRDLCCGALLGAALFSTVILELWAFGYYHVDGVAATPQLALGALLMLAGAIVEELLFRGVLFRLVEEWAGTWIALALSAVIFGIMHAPNPSATLFSTLAVALEAGVLLGAAFVVTRNLWLPIGLHFSWNFFEGSIFGTHVSGQTFFTSLFAAYVSGPTILTGGAFGPEAGIPALVTCFIVATVLLFWALRRRLIVPPKIFTKRPASQL